LAALSVLLVMGWRACHAWLPTLALVYVGLLALLSPWLLIAPAYSRPRPLTPAQIAALPASPGWRFGDIARLQSVTLLEQSVAAGGALPVRLCWQTLARAPKDYTVLLHLVGPRQQVVAARYTYPGLGRYPTAAWRPGETFCDQVVVAIPADLSPTLLYRVEVGLIDMAAMERLPAYDRDQAALDHTFATAVRLVAANSRPISNPRPPGLGPIDLRHYETADQWQPGGDHALRLVWQLLEPLDRDYTLFVHLRDPGTGRPVAQADGPPLDGWYPTSHWEVSEQVDDQRAFALPPTVAPGRYELVVGWYEASRGERLGPEFSLGMIEVRP
jgi:hypothetical protein